MYIDSYYIPPELILHIFSYLDLPDLASLSQLSPQLATLAADPALHNNRLRVIAPSRVNHSLFGQSPEGFPLRPTIPDLVHRGVMRGLNLERRWRMGAYLSSQPSILQYESGQRLLRRHAGNKVSLQLQRRLSAPDNALLKVLHQSHVLPDVESSRLAISRRLLPVVRKLKWSFQRDKLAKVARDGGGFVDFAHWLETRGKGIVPETERVRLAICPNVRKMVGAYERACC
ncbi:hypothetical protein BDZ89DRAFT_1100038 [Hymenopellis radicata]|nr:hypothetical protein BDZ89DRAFT_1100038 [Hymenopellis radicata]